MFVLLLPISGMREMKTGEGEVVKGARGNPNDETRNPNQ
jgi:hypothetical protein